MSKPSVGTVKIKQQCTEILRENLDRILVLFAAILSEKNPQRRPSKEGIVTYEVLLPGPEGVPRTVSADFITRLQKYVDDICAEGCTSAVLKNHLCSTNAGEDSSYDSDCDGDPSGPIGGPTGSHQDVSRTTSDTLAAEYAEYVQGAQQREGEDSTPGYTARVEFALKLGYTEKHVQAALQKLGSSPTQNELLAELIKLGAQKGGSCDSSPTESLVSDLGLLDRFESEGLLHSSLTHLRPIVIDGSNVAMGHGNKEIFSCRGIRICVDWFKARGHKDITVFVPKWRKEAPRLDNPVRDQDILAELEREKYLVYTPSRLVGGKRMVCYDDRYILKLAVQNDGVVVSNDNYRDLCQESPDFRKVVEERILMYSFVNDHFMPPDDPLGRGGPTLDNFLRVQRKGDLLSSQPAPPPCPYGKKCTYGNKCKYNHPERGPLPHKSVTERLSEHAQRHMQAREGGDIRKNPLSRTRSNVPPPKEPSQHQVVSKSRSVDNVGTIGVLETSAGGSLGTIGSYNHNAAPSENLHRKLQRQLTLNPSCDPRLSSSRRFGPQSPTVNSVAHPPLAGYLSAPGATWGGQQAADLHQNVTRIASAPDSYRSGAGTTQQQPGSWAPQALRQPIQQPSRQLDSRHMQRLSSCSEPQLNVWPSQWGPSMGLQTSAMGPQQEDARRKLHYHLAAIFPEEQVAHVMSMYPDETNPQKICAAILTMFSKP